MMQADHKENLNLLFYDFNKGSKAADDEENIHHFDVEGDH
jgi:hypothetical protein